MGWLKDHPFIIKVVYMRYFIEDTRVTRQEAKEYVDRIWGVGTLTKREFEAKEYFIQECDTWCSWVDGFAIQRGN